MVDYFKGLGFRNLLWQILCKKSKCNETLVSVIDSSFDVDNYLTIFSPDRPVARGVHRVHTHTYTGPKGPNFGTQGPTFRVQSVKVKDAYILQETRN